MNRVFLIIACLSLLPAGTPAEEPSFSTLEKQFREMPMEARRLTGPLFWLHGDDNETKERLEMYLGKVAEGHNGSFCAESRPHSDWLGPRWYSDLDICLQAAKKHNLKMWIFDEKWWPSQTVAGNVPPEYAAKKLEASAVTLNGPVGFVDVGFGSPNFITAIAGRLTQDGIDPESLVDLTPFSADGNLSWDVPPGKWQIMKFTWKQAPNARQGGAVTVDGASRDCVDWFLRTVYQPHYDRFKDDFGKTIVGFFYDEPETQGDWGTELSKVFAERGIDEKKALVAWKFQLAPPLNPPLTKGGIKGGSGEEQVAARYAYVDALAETWGRTMYGGSLKWCEERGVAFIGHFIEHDGWYLKPGLGAINLFQMQKYNAMGGMDLVCQQLWPGERRPGIYQLPKLTSSISHAYNKLDDLAMCEIFGAYGQGITYPQMKWLLDWHQVRGVNFMIPHSFNPKAPNDTDCPPYFYNGGAEPRWPLYRVWADYSSRLSLLLTGGRHVCPVAFLFCGNSAYVGKVVMPEDMTTVLQDALYDCDWLPYEVFEGKAAVSGREVRLYDERYKVLIVPPVEVIPHETLAKARDFFEAGGIVVGYDFLPTKSASFGHTSAEINALCDAIWGQGDPGFGVRKISAAGGRSYFLPGRVTRDEIRQVLARDAKVRPALDVLEGETAGRLHVLHRAKSGRDVFLVCNQEHQGRPKRFRLRVRASGEPECWDAMRNEITRIPYARMGPDMVEFYLTLEPMESALIVFQPKRIARPARFSSQLRPKLAIPVVRNKLSEKDAESAPGLLECSWVWYPEGDPEVSAPAGTRWFRREIRIPAGRKIKRARFLLSADNEFVLYVNGKVAGKSSGDNAWQRPKELQITKFLKPGVNVLAIAATNATDHPSPAGLIGTCSIGFEQSPSLVWCIDETWKASNREEAGWNTVGFDDEKWVAAGEIAKFGEGPWGSIGSFIMPADPFVGRCTIPKGVDLARARVYLEMDELHEGASVKVNGRFAGGVIGRPFRLDVTKQLKPGTNTIEIEPFAPKSVRLLAGR
jgi:hypothetical protein